MINYNQNLEWNGWMDHKINSLWGKYEDQDDLDKIILDHCGEDNLQQQQNEDNNTEQQLRTIKPAAATISASRSTQNACRRNTQKNKRDEVLKMRGVQSLPKLVLR